MKKGTLFLGVCLFKMTYSYFYSFNISSYRWIVVSQPPALFAFISGSRQQTKSDDSYPLMGIRTVTSRLSSFILFFR